MPVFQFNKVVGIGRGIKAFLNLEGGFTRGAVPDNDLRREQIPELKAAMKQIEKQRRMLEIKERENTRLKAKLSGSLGSAGSRPEGQGASRAAGESEAGALPDFIVIGGQRCGSSFCYRRLLSWHPYVEPAVRKEVHYFDLYFDEGVDWYRSNFPPPARKEEGRVLTGEASPDYLFHPHVPRRAAEVVPGARLIALLRNPVDRAYSAYYLQTRQGRETLSFEGAIEAEEDRLQGEKDRMLADESYESPNRRYFSYQTMGIYVDQLREWHKFFDRDQVLVLKSEDLYDRTPETLKLIQNFLDLPEWQPELSALSKDPETRYSPMNPATRQRLEDYFEPHNQRLYEYLGVDFGW